MILQKISEWALQWKMNFNPDPTKQAQVHQVQLQKHLGLFFDPKLSFDEHIQCISIKTRKIIGLIRKLQPIMPRTALLTIYKSFLRPHLDYEDVMIAHLANLSEMSLFNIMPHWQLQELPEVPQDRSFIKN